MRWTKAAVLCTSAVVFGSVHPAVADEHDQTESIQDESIQDECTDAEDPPTPTVLEVSEVPIVVDSTTADYFVLYVSHDVDGQSLQIPVAVVLGETGTTTLAENVEALPAERYRVEKYLVADPADVDGDCTDDITELADSVGMNPVNPEAGLGINDGAVAIPDRATYDALAAGQIVKFTIYDIDTNLPGIYFHNTNTYEMHPVVGIQPRRFITGVVSYNSGLAAPDSSTGAYYTFIPGVFSFDFAERVYAVLAAAMPLLDDDLLLHIPNNRLRQFQSQLALFRESRIDLVFDEDIYAGVDFDPLNPGVGYGRLRSLDSDERPHPRDVVIFGTLPNELPRVAGIISAVPQTPLSHVNLRAVQNGVPNAFIRGVLDDPSVTALLDGFVRYGVTGDDGWNLRAATVEEVDAHYASSRPTKMQAPQRDLSVTTITPLSDIGFDDWDAFGVKAANVAVLGKLGFVDGTVPDGFSIPFYFYDEFMKTTGLCARVEAMLADPDFQNDFDTQNDELQKLRTAIKDAQTPAWITAALTEMHNEFPQGTSLRYRSSTNNEDLPGFNGAGLYDSKTQHPDETVEDGIAKSLKQVYASLWNFRAFSERDFHRIDHSTTAMGVLVHPNYSDELANGVAVSFNLVHNLRSSYYVNTQLGEDLVTNPDAFSKPEELLLYWDLGHPNYYVVLGTSNLTPPGQLLMSDEQIRQLRLHLKAIHDHFKGLYAPAGGEPFAMEIEFKITSVDVLAIKQARPWVFASAGSAQSTSTATTDDSSSCDPSAINPGVVDPGVVDPGVVDPGVVDPGVVDPGVVDPGVVDPGVVDPGVVDPGVVDPGVVDPGVVDPGVVDPGVVDPGVVDPGVVDPGVVDPGVVDPGVVDPGVVDPGVVDPGVVDPGVVDPGVVDPGVVDPGVVDPGVVDPGVVDPGVVDGDGVVDPGVVDPGVVDPGVVDGDGVVDLGVVDGDGVVDPGVVDPGVVGVVDGVVDGDGDSDGEGDAQERLVGVEVVGSGFVAATVPVAFTVAVVGDGEPSDFVWRVSGPDGFSATGDAEQFRFIPPGGGVFTVSVTVTGVGGETVAGSFEVTVLADIADSTFVDEIIWLATQGITRGCGSGRFCPDDNVTRGQMAAFLSRALQLPPTDIDYFDDDGGSVFEDDINRLALAEITTGCGTRMFCPDDGVTRGQMAAFLSRALQLPAAADDFFDDDAGSTFEADINRLAQSEITTGCGPRRFCPDDNVTRGQMAAFLYRARDRIAANRTP